MSEKQRFWKQEQIKLIVRFAATQGGIFIPSQNNWQETLDHLTDLQVKNIFRCLPGELKGKRKTWTDGLTDNEVIQVVENLNDISARDDNVSERLRELGIGECSPQALQVFMRDTSFPHQLKEFEQEISRR